jgi:hypothetical protein
MKSGLGGIGSQTKEGGARDEREAKQGGRAEAAALKRVVEKKSAAVTSHTIVLQR